jgi:hypothetical protein
MIYLVQYDRKQGKILDKKAFPSTDRAFAQRERLTIELEFRKSGMPYEVVLLEAADEEILKRIHQRYFKSASEIVESMIQPDTPQE